SGELVARLRPLLDLGRAVGRLATQISVGRVAAIEVHYAGTDEEALKPVMLAAIEGALAGMGIEQVSMVNALAVAEGRGIRLSRRIGSPEAGFETTVEVRVKAGDDGPTVAGALFGERVGRVIGINGFAVEFLPEGYVIVVRNRDVPGVIGRVGT